jgi:3-oxoacyl-(acyl-carrier-protein) synthase
MSRRVFVTGYGVITAIGNNAEENYQSLIHENCPFGRLEILETVHRDTIQAFEVKLTDDALCEKAGVPAGAGYTRTTLLALIAAREAISSASLSEEDVREAGIVSATTAGGVRELETYYADLQEPQKEGVFLAYLDTADPGEHTERLADIFQIRKYVGTVSTACSSATNAIMLGARLIAHRVVERVVCGGSEALSKVTINGFNTLMILDRNPCRPFDENRNGLNLGEGAAYLVLESEEMLRRSGKRAIAELRGYANVNDAFHQTAASPDGAGACEAMRKAIAMAGLAAADIDYINAHGTGTENNDLAEALAIRTLFSDHPPPFSSTKPYTGHTTSAAGSVEAAFCMMALQHDVVFPNLNFREPMKEIALRPVTEVRWEAGLKNILSNSFGFGGGASALLFSQCL